MEYENYKKEEDEKKKRELFNLIDQKRMEMMAKRKVDNKDFENIVKVLSEVDMDLEDIEILNLEVEQEKALEKLKGLKRVDHPCVPERRKNGKGCSFSGDFISTPQRAQKLKLFPFSSIPNITRGKDIEEFRDYLNEFPVFVLKRGTTLIHSTHIHTVERISLKHDELRAKLADTCWWKKYFPGAKSYGGGWFTHTSSYGGPTFGMYLYYKLEKDLPVLYIPKYDKKINNPEYITKTAHVNEALDEYSSSHIIQGPRGWKKKGYQNLHEKDSYFADGLGKRLSELGFNGYISCDECEVFISHKAMEDGVISYPYRIDYNGEYENDSEKNVKILEFITDYCSGGGTEPLQVTTAETREDAKKSISFRRNTKFEKLLKSLK